MNAVAIPTQITAGTEIVTVARDGSKMANIGRFSVPIFTTAIYIATARKSDGKLTWRRNGSISYHSTSGHAPSGRMVERAKAYAAEHGLQYCAGVRHGKIAG